MNHPKQDSRRNFIKHSSLGLGTVLMGMNVPVLANDHHVAKNAKLPRQICVATMDIKTYMPDWPDKTREARVKRMLGRMEELTGLQPDIICLPELFDTMWVEEPLKVSEVAEDETVPGAVTSKIAAFAKKNNCHVICPIYTKKNGHYYNSSLLIDRKGAIAGVYHKTHPVKSEMIVDSDVGVMAGAIDQPVFETDFGKVGMQICYDAYWSDGWDNLHDKGADIVFFSSAMPAGRILNYYASRNEYYIVSSTGNDARVIDKSGNDLDCTSDFVRLAWATINLNKVNVDLWPPSRISDMYKKYGNKIGIRVWTNTDVATVESLDPDLNIRTVIKEFDIPVFSEYIKTETSIHEQYRQASLKK